MISEISQEKNQICFLDGIILYLIVTEESKKETIRSNTKEKTQTTRRE
jgi:hypothetical protein